MIYFKSVQVPDSEKQLLENAIRRVAIKRTRSLDLTSAVHDMGAEKLFLGLEDKHDVKFTRLRTSLERFFPTIIISFPKDEPNSGYKFRLGLAPTCFFVLFALGFLATTVSTLINHYDYDAIIVPLPVLGVFILLAWLELKIVEGRMRKAVARYGNEATGN